MNTRTIAILGLVAPLGVGGCDRTKIVEPAEPALQLVPLLKRSELLADASRITLPLAVHLSLSNLTTTPTASVATLRGAIEASTVKLMPVSKSGGFEGLAVLTLDKQTTTIVTANALGTTVQLQVKTSASDGEYCVSAAELISLTADAGTTREHCWAVQKDAGSNATVVEAGANPPTLDAASPDAGDASDATQDADAN